MGLVQHIADGVAALRDGRATEAAAALAIAYGDEELAAADDLRDIRARVCSLYAQALVETGELTRADTVCREAIRLARAERDVDGLAQVRELQDRIVGLLAHDAHAAQRDAEQARIAQTPLEALLGEGGIRAEVLTKKASALVDTGDADAARALAEQAVQEADTIEWSVLSRVTLARAAPDQAAEALAAAHALAADAGEFNLVSVVARASEELAVPLPVEPGPHHGRDAGGG